MFTIKELKDAARKSVLLSYESAKAANEYSFKSGDVKATLEYIYENQKEDAQNIVNKFYEGVVRVISIQKRTKVGADGLMIEIAKLMTTHHDDDFIINPDNIRIVTGMSNIGWEKDMIDKSPCCFKDKIFHHGKLTKTMLNNIRDALIIIDEIDTGDKDNQVLHRTLKDAGVLNVKYMKDNNIRFIFISATMIRELYELYTWGELHETYMMTIPSSYIGHNDFLHMGIIKEFYPINTIENARRWINEDIINNYRTDYRVHIIRVNGRSKSCDLIQNACIHQHIDFQIHNSKDRLSQNELNVLFEKPLKNHIVLVIMGFLRRANLLPNCWKVRIGATHELFSQKIDNNVQVQGLPGRMTGYWRELIESGHKTGPYRTSIHAIMEYEKNYNDPFGNHSYQAANFKKTNKKIHNKGNIFLASKNISYLDSIEYPMLRNKSSRPIIIISINDEDKKYHNHMDIMEIIKKYNRNAYDLYNTYELHCWKIDTPDKERKWCLDSMLKNGAYSTVTNISDKNMNIATVYLYQNMLIINAWNGKT